MNSVERAAEGIRFEHITLYDFRATAHPGSSEFRASREAAHRMAVGLKLLEQPPSDIPGRSSEEYQGLLIRGFIEEQSYGLRSCRRVTVLTFTPSIVTHFTLPQGQKG